MDVFECIKTRRSIRNYSALPISKSDIDNLIQAAIWAPSGKNSQPWKFKVITDKILIENISDLSVYGRWMKSAACLILVYLDKEKSYNYVKDIQSCGASIQNILLCAHEMQIGSCWVGEILDKSKEISELLKISQEQFELMAVITLGYKSSRKSISNRYAINSFLI